jgi:hypothetical protein
MRIAVDALSGASPMVATSSAKPDMVVLMQALELQLGRLEHAQLSQRPRHVDDKASHQQLRGSALAKMHDQLATSRCRHADPCLISDSPDPCGRRRVPKHRHHPAATLDRDAHNRAARTSKA